MPKNTLCLFIFSLMAFTSQSNAGIERSQIGDAPSSQTASEILWSIQKLNTLGRVLYVAAHPDDENTSLISYLSLGGKYDTAYLSMTRGDGGQNLIGPEIRDKLGVIRTQELLAARRIDGGKQFFTRAKDFGFSKTPDETLKIWDKEKVLADVVWVIRNFRPDVIVTRFRPEPGGTHGHHTASCILALEAFEAAADPSRFPEQLALVEPWQAKRVAWNTSSWFFSRSGQEFNASDYVSLEVGGYEPLLGKSFNEISSASRSMHRSQGFGTRIDRGSRTEYFKNLTGEPMSDSLFDGVNTSWSRVGGFSEIAEQVDSLIKKFDARNPSASVSGLLAIRSKLNKSKDSWAISKRCEIDEIIASCLGLSALAIADAPFVVEGQPLAVELEILNRSDVPVELVSAKVTGSADAQNYNQALANNQRLDTNLSINLPKTITPTQPYWLRNEASLGMFAVDSLNLIGLPENMAEYNCELVFKVAGESIALATPVVYRDVNPAKGESLKSVLNVAPASISVDSPVALFANYRSREINVTVSATFAAIEGAIEVEAPAGWKVDPVSYASQQIEKGGQRVVSFKVTPPSISEETQLAFKLRTPTGEVFGDTLTRIQYDHIPEQVVIEPSVARAVSLSVEKRGERVGYIEGAGDSMMEGIAEIGYQVEALDLEQISVEMLSQYDSVVIGIRAYNTLDGIDRVMPILFEYVKQGGTVISQYNTGHRLKTEQLAPYPLSISRDRTTDENAEMRILAPNHAALNSPNKITQADFDGWTQERGLYFPNKWDDAFTALVSCNDEGEPARNGSLLIAQYGEGYFVYSGLSWFRQLPAGVPGAYRLFANLLSLGN